MNLTEKQKSIKERQSFVCEAYNNRDKAFPVTPLIKELAKKFKVTEITIWGDIKSGKNETV